MQPDSIVAGEGQRLGENLSHGFPAWAGNTAEIPSTFDAQLRLPDGTDEAVIAPAELDQAIRVADTTAFFSVDISQGTRTGYLVEMGPTAQIFENPREQMTGDYISGKFS